MHVQRKVCFEMKKSDVKITVSKEELSIICRALSDSMNYKPNVLFSEKWELLLKLKNIEIRSF